MKEISNGKNVDNLRKREYLRKGMLASSFLTIIFAVLDIVFNNYIFLIIALLFFVIANVCNRLREKTIIRKKDEIDKQMDKFIKNSDKKEKKKTVKKKNTKVKK